MAAMGWNVRCRGFTLLEMAVSLVIVALLTGLVLQAEHATKPDLCYETTQTQLNTIRTALDNFMTRNNRLPFPAARNYGVTNPQYGQEAAGAAITQTADGVYFGALPFQALGLPTSFAADCWGNKFTYAVTVLLTTPGAAAPVKIPGFLDPDTLGNITINSGTLLSHTLLTGTAAYAVISHGLDGSKHGNGAVARNYTGTEFGWCATPGAGSNAIDPIEHKNCDASNGVLYSSPFNNGKTAGTAYFDDVMIYSGKPNVNCNMPGTTESWAVADGTQCSGKVPTVVATNETTLVTNTLINSPNRIGSASYQCINGLFNPKTPPAVTCREDGHCDNNYNGQTLSSPPSGTQGCNGGAPSPITTTVVAGVTTYHWTCAGEGNNALGNATSESCSATELSGTPPPTCASQAISFGGGVCSTSGSFGGGTPLTAIQNAGEEACAGTDDGTNTNGNGCFRCQADGSVVLIPAESWCNDQYGHPIPLP